MSACRKACSEADDPLPDVSVDVDPLLALVLFDVVVLGVEPIDAAVDPVLALVVVESVPVVEGVDAVLPLVADVSALTSAWKSC
jgi:hypothetical protein